ncbi:Type 1 glutamine amidotransferase-like domain-containing protein [Dactylosporangium vinaceum]|uniref:Type 1 glutamine amidotransferase-like domain-containing protein n=1 Tax=Dactylosporangium vinaceum TaxID=53362 RepID=A0ABV5M2Y3_9ACTN|nr:Type 1 glutamine amidotransferase-like domain-containing protein [Dactylosporangium vinaceum]UAB99838.1 Type 1 glutamine amidotransferase-like domain-containing protein [Dactylosporangium vinaceum]
MKLLLTSGGLRNARLLDALGELVGRPFAAANVVYIATASMAEPGDHSWVLQDLARVHGLGWRQFDVLELNGLPPTLVRDRLLQADVIYVSGGNHYHLARSITGNNLTGIFLEALESRVYVGLSAGSMIFSRHLTEHAAEVIGDAADLHLLGATTVEAPFGLFDWYLKPHLYSPDFPERDDAWADAIAARADFPIYFIDDDTAVRVDDTQVDVVSDGRWRLHPHDATISPSLPPAPA